MELKKSSDFAAPRFQFVFFLVFAVVPSLLLYVGWTFFREQQVAVSKKSAVPEIRRELLKLRREGDNRSHVQSRLNFMYGNMAEENYSEAIIEASLARFKEEGFGFVNFRFFKHDGSPLNVKGQSDGRRAVLQKIFEALLQQETTGESSLLARNRPFFDAFAGGVTPAAIAQDKSSLIRVMMNGHPGYFYWNTLYSAEPESRLKGGLVAWFRESDMPENMALEQLLESLNLEWRGQKVFGLVDLASPSRSLLPDRALLSANVSIQDLASHLRVMRNNFESQSEIGDSLILSEFFTADAMLFCLQRSPESSYQNTAVLLKIILLVWMLVVVKVGGTVSPACTLQPGTRSVATACFGLSWRQFMTLTAGMVPLCFVLLLGCQYRDAYAQMLTRNAFDDLTDKLERVDENYQVAVRNLEAVYRQFAGLRAVRDLDTGEIDRLAKELKRKDAINRFYIADRSGRMCYSWPPGKISGDVTTKIMPAISRRIFITQRGDEESFQDKVSEMMMDSFSDSFGDMLGDTGASLLRTFENLDRVNEFWLANRRHYVYTAFVERGIDKDPWLLYIWHGTESFAERYLQRQIQRNVSAQNLQGAAIHLAMVPRDRSQLPFPRDFNKYPFVAQLSGQIASTEIQQNLIGSMAGEKWLVAAAPLKRVPAYLLYAMTPYSSVEQKTFQVTLLVFLLAALCLVSTISVAAIIDDL